MKKVLFVIDYQKDFVDGSLGFEKGPTLEEGIYNRVMEYLSEGHRVVFTYDTHYDNYLETREGKNLPIKHCILNTEGHEAYGRLKEFRNAKNTIHINKESFGIAPKDMIKLSEELGEDIEQFELTGVATDICVISNFVTLQAQYTNAEIVVNEKLCASFNDKMHEEAINVMKSLQARCI